MQSDTGKENDKSTHVLTTDSKKSDVQAAQGYLRSNFLRFPGSDTGCTGFIRKYFIPDSDESSPAMRQALLAFERDSHYYNSNFTGEADGEGWKRRSTERLRRSTRFCKSLTKLAGEPRGPFTLPV